MPQAFIMKKSILYITLFLCVANTTFAQETQTTPIIPQDKTEAEQILEEKRLALQPEIVKKKVELKAFIEAKKEADVSPIQVLARERILKAVTVLFERMEAFLVRYDTIVTRLENRILTMDPSSTQEAQALLVIAKTNLTESTILISATKDELTTNLQTQTTSETIRSIITLSTESLKKTHESLISVIQTIKADDISLTE